MGFIAITPLNANRDRESSAPPAEATIVRRPRGVRSPHSEDASEDPGASAWAWASGAVPAGRVVWWAPGRRRSRHRGIGERAPGSPTPRRSPACTRRSAPLPARRRPGAVGQRRIELRGQDDRGVVGDLELHGDHGFDSAPDETLCHAGEGVGGVGSCPSHAFRTASCKVWWFWNSVRRDSALTALLLPFSSRAAAPRPGLARRIRRAR